jgi:plasmid maintenance system killer protein
VRLGFADARLELVETERFRETGLPDSVVVECRRRLNFIRNAVDEGDLINWRSLRYEASLGDDRALRSLRITGQWRIFVRLTSTGEEVCVTVLDIAQSGSALR